MYRTFKERLHIKNRDRACARGSSKASFASSSDVPVTIFVGHSPKPADLMGFQQLLSAINCTPESNDRPPVFERDIEKSGYEDYSIPNRVNHQVFSDYRIVSEYKNGDIVTISMDAIVIESPKWKLKKWWSISKADKKSLIRAVDGIFPTCRV